MHPTHYYKMDAAHHVLEGLQVDTGVYLEHMRQQTTNRLAKTHIEQSAGLYVSPGEHPAARGLKIGAFVAGGLTTYEAFIQSELDTETSWAVRWHFKQQPSLAHMDSYPRDITADIINTLAYRGLKDHPELKEHAQYLSRFYTEVAQDPKYGESSIVGLGYVACRFDHLLETFTHSQLRAVFGVDTSNIDWDAALREIN